MIASPVRHLSLLGSPLSAQRLMDSARQAQSLWMDSSIGRRLRVVREFRRLLPERFEEVVGSIAIAERRSPAETLSGEVLPLAAACRFLERRAARVLRSRRLTTGRPRWLGGSSIEIERAPMGLVLIIGAGNYPVFLTGVQVLQALVAGNAVLLKPAPGGEQAARVLAELLLAAGLPEGLLVLLDGAPEAARQAIAHGVDKVVLTGSSATGREVLRQLSERLTPAAMELSGCDAVFVHPSADPAQVAAALAFGITFNSGATCIAPRRVFVTHPHVRPLESCLRDRLAGTSALRVDSRRAERLQQLVEAAVAAGARLVTGTLPFDGGLEPLVLAGVTPEMELARADLMAPVLSLIEVETMDEALRFDARCPYALGATVFGSRREADHLARRVQAGVVVVNDMIAPTADPRIPFGGRAESGFGLTRGPEGLLELTQPRVLISRGGSWRPHFEPLEPGDEAIFAGLLRARHGRSRRDRFSGWIEMSRALRRRARRSQGK